MNKKLIAVAVAAAFAAPMAASADAVVYGNITTHAGFTEVKKDGATTEDKAIVDTGDGSLGIKGSEDLGNGLKAVYKYEIDFATDTGDVAETDEVWVGLSGGFGTVALGREDHPYKNVLNASGYNPFGDTIVDMDNWNLNDGNSSTANVGFRQQTADNAVLYITPNFSGFSAQGAIVAPEGDEDSGVNNGFDAYSLGVNYAGGGLKVGVAYEDIDVFEDAEGTSAWVLAGSYTFGAFKVGAAYEEQDDARRSAGGTLIADDVETFGLSAVATFGNNEIGAAYVMEEQDGLGGVAGTSRDIDSWGLIARHNFSNRTQVYAAYANAEADVSTNTNGDDETETFAIGLNHSF